ncbi:MAG TPA: endopeptidase La [Candidatus Hydrogenedens sp.]|nr:endopeptidase La [Candidatus Hydrogenedens sp.]HOL20873.1 endopeptidase La [Candidatus Hydrogenedens sp.]HPP59470.1 endopeptidase La [Candidatus Hydrogenedens sp.]
MKSKKQKSKSTIINANRIFELPVLPVHDIVLFPKTTTPLLVSRETSVCAIEESIRSSELIFIVLSKEKADDTKEKEAYHNTGVIAQIQQTLALPNGILKIFVETLSRGHIKEWKQFEPFISAKIEQISLEFPQQNLNRNKELRALRSLILKEFKTYITENTKIPIEVLNTLRECESYEDFSNIICTHLHIHTLERQNLLETLSLTSLLKKIAKYLIRENRLSQEEKLLSTSIKEYTDDGSEPWLTDNQTESGIDLQGLSDYFSDTEELKQLINKTNLPPHVLEKANSELKRLEKLQTFSPESSTIREYIEWLCSLPWDKRTKDQMDLNRAKKILDKNHFGLDKVKDRILDFLAVRILSGNLTKGPILCFVGPPGVGKTSLGNSIASALDRKFIRMSLGGIRDEAEIRGHMRTYVASMPGRIIQNIKKANVINPVFVLDEVDKIGNDFRGDPASALLEVLDPEQNKYFMDHYLDVEFDLSEIFFIATANYEYDILPPLYDRMEIIKIPGYTPNEKFEIAIKYLIPKQIKIAGLHKKDLVFKPDTIRYLISKYTEESGVRELERQISGIIRKVARWIVTNVKKPPIILTQEEVENILGPPIYSRSQTIKNLSSGVAVGLAWTPYGGIVQIIETSIMKGKGSLLCTGQLGSVMTESAQTALTYIRANASHFKLSPDFYKQLDIHVHAPEASIPKDGPSAGITIAVSILSSLLKQSIKEGVAMTGEITLTGRILPVGGIREKLLAAHTLGIREVILPKENEKDIRELPNEIKKSLKFIFVENMKQVFEVVFPKQLA